MLLFALWFACNGDDHDRDGYPVLVDCNDDDAAVHPDALESCNGIDDDCDEYVDEGVEDAPHWYFDMDQDGYGTEQGRIQACEAPPGYVDVAGDCIANRADSYPGAPELCDDNRDNNCDGNRDEGC